MITVNVTGEDYLKCHAYSKDNWSSTKKGSYGKGIANNSKDPNKIERVSKISEVAVAKLFSSPPPDFKYRKWGDKGHDLSISALTCDVKCSIRKSNKSYFKGVTNNNRSTVKADIYIFCYLAKETTSYASASIAIVGYLTKDEILAKDLVVPSKGWSDAKCNYELEHSEFHPIEELMEEFGVEIEG